MIALAKLCVVRVSGKIEKMLPVTGNWFETTYRPISTCEFIWQLIYDSNDSNGYIQLICEKIARGIEITSMFTKSEIGFPTTPK